MPKVIFFLFLTLLTNGSERTTPESYHIKRLLHLSWEVKNISNENLSDVKFSFLLPVKQTSTQFLEKTEISHKGSVQEDSYGNQVYTVKLNLAPYESAIIRQKAFLLLSTEPSEIPLEIPKVKIAEVNSPVARLASSLKKTSDIETVQNTFTWIEREIKLEKYSGSLRDSDQTLSKKLANNKERVELLHKSLNALHIPNYKASGFIVSNNSKLRPTSITSWNSFAYEGKWLNSYIPKKLFNEKNNHFITFKIHGNSVDKWMNGKSIYHLQSKNLNKLKISIN